jgi:hypothetical protein
MSMAEAMRCADCEFRAKYDNRPTSVLGRMWRWHAGWCPGWRQYMESLPAEGRIEIATRYRLKKYL